MPKRKKISETKPQNRILSPEEFTRLVHNFYVSKNLEVPIDRIALDSQLITYFAQNAAQEPKRFKIALCCICVNPPYWPYIRPMMDSARQFFLPGHDLEFLLWSDLPSEIPGATIFPIESLEWPYPTLLRYSLMLQQEEKLKEYDYIFFCDADMKFVNVLGDEVLGDGLTAAQHPMYATRKELWPPYEPNEKSLAYFKRPGKIMSDNGKPRFLPLYIAGGFQGGKTEAWLKAIKEMKKNIDADLVNNYIAIWNDESHWNKYLYNHPDEFTNILNPSVIYPDSLIKEYYEPVVWGQSFNPTLVTLTKPHTMSAEGGQEIAQMLQKPKLQ